MKRKINFSKILNRISTTLEFLIALTLIAAVAMLLIELISSFGLAYFRDGALDFNNILTKALNLIIGLEFTRMLCRHTPETVIEVLLFATARQVIVAHSTALDTLLSILCIAILFLIRKYVLDSREHD